MKQPLLESDVTIIGTLIGPGDFRYAQQPESVSPDTRRTVEQLCNGYKTQEKAQLEKAETCLTRI